MDVVPRKERRAWKLPPELKEFGIDVKEFNKFMFPNRAFNHTDYDQQLYEMMFDRRLRLKPPREIFPPLKDEYYFDHLERVIHQLALSICRHFQSSKFHTSELKRIQFGEAVDLKSLLFPSTGDYLIRRKGRSTIKAKNIHGKYILVCCCYPPVLNAAAAQLALYACSEMYSKLKGNFEMVVVTQMRHGWTHPRAREKDAFRQFFSPFPSSCLAVPLHARSLRRRICISLAATHNPLEPIILLVGPDGKVLLHTELFTGMRHLELAPLNVFGSDPTPFPFIARSSDSLQPFQTVPNCPSSLKGYLSPFSDFVFRKKVVFSKECPSSKPTFVEEKVSLSDLNSKTVALYLHSDGDQIPLLIHIANSCSMNDKDLEVVVVSIDVTYSLQSFPEDFSTVLAKRGLSWWVAPYNFSASSVLKELFLYEGIYDGDQVIIIGPNDLYVDVRGLQIMQIYGLNGYPFTLESVVRNTVEELQQFTLDSFLKLLKLEDLEQRPTAKKVLFYFDFPHDVSPPVYNQVERFLKYYQVVDVCLISLVDNETFRKHAKNHRPGNDTESTHPHTLLWRTQGADNIENFFLRFFNHVFPTMFAFGEDGKICSILAHELPPSGDPEMKGSLVEEVSSVLEKYLTDYDHKRYIHEGDFNHNLPTLQALRRNPLRF